MILEKRGEYYSGGLDIKWHRSLDEVASLEADWTGLRKSTISRTIFTDYDFIFCWYNNYCRAIGTKEIRNPLVGTVWQNGCLVGIFPLVARTIKSRYILIQRIDIAGFSFDGGEFLFPGDRIDVVGEFIVSLVSKIDFDIFCIGNLEKNSVVYCAVEDVLEKFSIVKEYEEYFYAVVDLNGGYENYCRKKGKNFRRNLRRHEETITGVGRIKIDRIAPTAQAPQDLSGFIPRMFDIGERGWRALQAGLDIEKFHQNFYSDLLDLYAQKGMVDLCILSLEGKDVAFVLGIVEDGVYYEISTAYDHYYREYSPGTYLLQELFKVLSDSGVKKVISHGDHEYKRRWATDYLPVYRAFIYKPCLKSSIMHFIKYSVKKRFKEYRDAMEM